MVWVLLKAGFTCAAKITIYCPENNDVPDFNDRLFRDTKNYTGFNKTINQERIY